MKGISTHVLDTSIGRPAEGVMIKLERNTPGSGWTLIAESVTDVSGRVAQLLPPTDHLHMGGYRLRFDVIAFDRAGRLLRRRDVLAGHVGG